MLFPLSRLALPVVLTALSSIASADIFLTNRNGNSVLVFADGATGNVAPIRRIQGPLTLIGTGGSLNGIAVDVEHGEVFVSLRTNRILVFDINANGNVAPLRTIGGAATGLNFPASLAVDPIHDELYAVNLSANGLCVFSRTAAGNAAPLRVISGAATGIRQPTGIFVDLDANEVYLTNEASSAPGVNVFPRLGNGNVAPLRQIMGPATTFNFATGLFRNPATGELLVADLTSGRALTFAEGANGNVAPTSVLTSAALGGPAGLTLTNASEMLVVDLFGNGLVGFDVQSGGATAAMRELRGPLTELSTPIYVASTNSPFPGAVFTSASAATLATRNAGANPASYSASGAPVLGSTITLSVDLSTTGHTSASVFATVAPANVSLSGGRVVLIGGPQVFTLGPATGPTATFQVSVPLDLGLAGTTLSTQAVHVFGVTPFALSNAVDLTAGV